MAAGVPGEDVSTTADAGAAHEMPGTASGLSASSPDDYLWTQSETGDGSSESGDQFGQAAACGDFNGDSLDDLAVGAPFEDVGSTSNAGAVNWIKGAGDGGLGPAGGDILYQGSGGGLTGSPETSDYVGWALASCDFNGDGKDDLAIGAPQEDYEAANSGVVHVVYGSSNGLTTTGQNLITQDTFDGNGSEANDYFGDSLACGDFNGSGHDDLAIGAPQEDYVGEANAGAVFVIYGSGNGLNTAADEVITQDRWGGLGPEAGDYFGDSLAAGDFNRDGYDDLAGGAPLEDVDPTADAGAVFVIRGTSTWLTGGPQVLRQDDWGGYGPEAGDQFGKALAAGDFSGEGYDDLAIGAPMEDINAATDAGVINAMHGASNGLTAAPQELRQDELGGAIESGDQMGGALGACDFNGDAKDDLAAGSAGEDVGSTGNAGVVNVAYGATGGIENGSVQQWYQGHNGMEGEPEQSDILGSAIATCRW
jgi:hypothetical protein